MAWIKSHQDLANHPKVAMLADALGMSEPAIIGHLHLFWWWVLAYAPDGDVTKYPATLIARGAKIPDEKAQQFVDEMLRIGFLDKCGKKTIVHDWLDFAGEYLNKCERQRRYRNCKRVTSRETSRVTSRVTSRATSRATSKNRSDQNRIDKNSRSDLNPPLPPLSGGEQKSQGKFDPLTYLLALGVPDQTARDWLAHRKSKRATATMTAIDRIAAEAKKAELSLAEALAESIANGWQGFRADWLAARKSAAARASPGMLRNMARWEHNHRVIEAVCGASEPVPLADILATPAKKENNNA